MLITASHFKDFTIRAKDGELGTISGFYFDDQTWAVRYLLVETGNWLSGRTVLISPFSVIDVGWGTKHVELSLTKEQVEKSPRIDTQKPVFRQHEVEFLGYYGYPYYWGGPYLWGSGYYPGNFTTWANLSAKAATTNSDGQPYDSHLRSTGEVNGYDVMSVDGEIGHVDGFVIDDHTWAIRYLEIATRNWWPGKKVLISPAWIERVSWLENRVSIEVVREAIKSAPEYIESRALRVSMRDSCILITASRHIGCMKMNLHLPQALLEPWHPNSLVLADPKLARPICQYRNTSSRLTAVDART